MSSATSNIEIILSELDEDGILRLTLNDPSRHNALSEAMLEKLKLPWISRLETLLFA